MARFFSRQILLPLPTIRPSVDAVSGSLPELVMMQTFALQSGLVRQSVEHRDLVPEGQILQGQFVFRTKAGQQVPQKRRDNREHG